MGKIQYSSLTKNRLEETMKLLKKSFLPYENICTAVGLAKKPEAFADLDDMIIDTARQGVSVVAVDGETGKLVGATLNRIDTKNTCSKKYYEKYINNAKYEESKSLFKVFIEMEEQVDPYSLYNVDCLMEMFMGVVASGYGNRGISHKLLEESMEIATQLYKGNNVKTPLDDTELPLDPRPQIVTGISTNLQMQKNCLKVGLDVIKTISYDDMYHNGKSYSSILANGSTGYTIGCRKLI